MRVHWHAIRWRRVIAVVSALVVFALIIPTLALAYLDKRVFTSDTNQDVSSLSENEKIRLSVRSELRDLEKKRTNIRYEIDRLQQEWDSLNEKIGRQQRDLNSVSLSLGEAIRTRDELSQIQPALLRIPLSIADNSIDKPKKAVQSTVSSCTLDQCFDYSRCPIKSYFQVYFYSLDESRLVGVSDSVRKQLSEAIKTNQQTTSNPHAACIFVDFVSSQLGVQNYSSLKFWNGDGANHLLIVLDNCTKSNCKVTPTDQVGRAIVARQTFATKAFRENFDIVLPTINDNANLISSLLPARRKYLLSFSGSYIEPPEDESDFNMAKTSLSDKYIAGLLGQFSIHDDLVAIRTNCVEDKEVYYVEGLVGQWIECEGTDDEPLPDSTFALIMAARSDYFVSSDVFIRRLLKIMRSGAVPVILGDFVRLPFDGYLEWEKVAVLLPKARATEVQFILKTYSDADIVALRRQGRMFLENYLNSPASVVETLLSVIRQSIKMPAPAEREEASNPVSNLSFGPVNQQFSSETDEMLGPLETPYPSLGYQRNFSLSLNFWRPLFNSDFSPHRVFPWRPDDPVLPSDAKFRGSSFGFRPIGFGAGGSGKEFSEALGGNSPREQFTAVVLTYERQQVLLEGISTLKGLPYLNKVLVVWNGPQDQGPETLTWPDIGVPVQVIKTKVNSLNNRFVPWDAIETEAVLSLDDDARLRHDELVFAFRVWRENRDRIVGFPGRFHAFDSTNKNWNYNSNHSCELSMVLTGAAFFHKYYMYSYTKHMYPEIRETVDKLMNCEDIALNFLVSHLTRKPPIKVTSKWTFRCPGCPVALSEHDSHFLERHDCINRFTQLYGYNPLLYTQLRADSVLFKTRVPHDKQKCFKYV